MTGLLRSLWERLFPPKPATCSHDVFTSDDRWLAVETEDTGREWWSERDAVYVKLRETKTLYVCDECGETTIRYSPERVTGPDAIVRKEDIRAGDADRPDAAAGAFRRGWCWWERNCEDLEQGRTLADALERFREVQRA